MTDVFTGGIDLGGTKMFAQIFNGDWEPVFEHEQPTPDESYETFLDALGRQVQLLIETGAEVVGVGAPGIVTREGVLLAANLAATGQRVPRDLARLTGRDVPFLKDCRAFALSEALLGAGRDAPSMFGLVIGTGVAGAFASEGRLAPSPNGMAGEIGHCPLPYELIARLGLPIFPCGCGRSGCYETYCSGPGIARLSERILGRAVAAEDLQGEDADEVLPVWAAITASLLDTIALAHDPDVIVLGGGVSRMPGIVQRLSEALDQIILSDRAPVLRLAEGGDRSGARGAALYARALASGQGSITGQSS